jgi:hypothetical protein
MARKAGGVACIVSGVMGDVDVRKPDRPYNKDAEESGEYGRGESVGSGQVPKSDSASGGDGECLHDRIRG